MRVVEYGSGASIKTRLLLDALERPAAYVPIDIARGALLESAARVALDYPGLYVQPVCADYTQRVELGVTRATRTLGFFPGSTLGNFEPDEAVTFLKRVREHCGDDGFLLIGVDSKKDRATLEAAYDDRAGVTAEFNRNILRVLNREHRAHFSLAQFQHRAVYDERYGRVEMHLVSTTRQRVAVAGEIIGFEAGEAIVTEHCYKYDRAEFHDLSTRSGFEPVFTWSDPHERFLVVLLRVV